MLKLMQAAPDIRTVSEGADVFFEGLTWTHVDLVEHVNQKVRVYVDVAEGLLHLVVQKLDGTHICNASQYPRGTPLRERITFKPMKGDML